MFRVTESARALVVSKTTIIAERAKVPHLLIVLIFPSCQSTSDSQNAIARSNSTCGSTSFRCFTESRKSLITPHNSKYSNHLQERGVLLFRAVTLGCRIRPIDFVKDSD